MKRLEYAGALVGYGPDRGAFSVTVQQGTWRRTPASGAYRLFDDRSIKAAQNRGKGKKKRLYNLLLSQVKCRKLEERQVKHDGRHVESHK